MFLMEFERMNLVLLLTFLPVLGTSWAYSQDCGSTSLIKNGQISLIQHDNTSSRAQATVKCSVGFSPNIPRVTCKASGQWENASCERISIVYLGCYADNQSRVLLPELPTSLTNTPEECSRRCSDYRYAGVEWK
ncbi:hypothetical protein DPMN_126084 [Dreissena polymorpha]|uniref:Sushi domain-containing protein n=1 Tax=Dreissena polymorpha TaxID=45954 RepID=A0A9D4GV29_DREPO|nr:hypothetical protein DPMN_126084 [Dreissena polymorpha]